MSEKLDTAIAVIGIDIGKNSFHVVGHDQRGAIVLHQKWSRGQVAARFANMPPCLIGMEACVGAHHLSRKLKAFGHDARLMPAKYVRPYSKGPSYSTRYRKAKASKGLTGSFGDRSWPRKAIIWAELAATKILRSVWRPRANSERARRPWFLMGMGCKRAIATPVLTVSATAKASSASKVQSLSGSVRCVASSAKPLVLRLPNMVSMVQR